MSGVLRSEPFPFKDMAEMAPTAGALDLDTLSVRIGDPTDGPRDLLVERGPTAVGVELVLRAVEYRSAALTLVRSRLKVALVLARERRLGTLPDDHALFGPGEGAKDGGFGVGHSSFIGRPY